MKPAADVIAHAAEGHRAKRHERHVDERRHCLSARYLAEKEKEFAGTGELRRAAESAVDVIEQVSEFRRDAISADAGNTGAPRAGASTPRS